MGASFDLSNSLLLLLAGTNIHKSDIKIDKLIKLNWLSNPAYLEVQSERVQRALIGLGPADH